MNEIPNGLTCADCRHFPRCSAMVGAQAANTECDFAPQRGLRHVRKKPNAV